jgi:hypothetical protein
MQHPHHVAAGPLALALLSVPNVQAFNIAVLITWILQVCRNSSADGTVQAVELYVQLSPNFSMSDLSLLVGNHHIEVTEKVRVKGSFAKHWLPCGTQALAVASGAAHCGMHTGPEPLTHDAGASLQPPPACRVATGRFPTC